MCRVLGRGYSFDMSRFFSDNRFTLFRKRSSRSSNGGRMPDQKAVNASRVALFEKRVSSHAAKGFEIFSRARIRRKNFQCGAWR
jgi:hypothetical protein